MQNKTIAKRLKILRGERSVAEVAAAIGVSKSTIGMYESGHRIPKDAIKKKIAEYFNSTVDAIFFTE